MNWMFAKVPALFAGITAASLGTTGCGGGGPSDSIEENTGSAVLHLQGAPTNIACLRVVATGTSRSETRDINLQIPSSTVTEALSRLPVGSVTFTGTAYSVACSQVTPTTNADYVSDPVTVTVNSTVPANVTLAMKRNGQIAVSANWEDAGNMPLCVPVDIAIGASTAESDAGWGGGSYPQEVVDGLTCYSEWPHGLAFTGGINQYMGEACGWRQLTLDFGYDRQLTGIIDIYHHGLEHVPNTAKIEVYSKGVWSEKFSTTTEHDFMLADTCPVGSTPTEHDIGPVTASKVRYSLNNCDITHGWIYEAIVQGCPE